MLAERACLTCGSTFFPTSVQIANRHGIYCSRACKSQAQITAVMQSCIICRKEFRVFQSQLRRGHGNHCSLSCAALARSRAIANLTTQRFWQKVKKSSIPDACWEWTGKPGPGGYGRFSVQGRLVVAHRYAYELIYGAIPDGLKVCHHCDNPPCVNPEHLFLGNQQMNVTDMHRKGRATKAYGERAPQARLREEDIYTIRMSNDSVAILAQRYRVSRASIYAIVKHKSWKHLP